MAQGDGQKPPKSASQAACKNAWNLLARIFEQWGKFPTSLWRFENTAVECDWDILFVVRFKGYVNVHKVARYLALTPQIHQSHRKRRTQEAQLNCKPDVS